MEGMCGRFVTFTVGDDLRDALSDVPGLAPVAADGHLPGQRWNVAPTMPVVALARPDPGDGGDAGAGDAGAGDAAPGDAAPGDAAPGPATIAAAVRWGLVPHWSKSMPKTPYFNARSETWREKPVFRNGRPCIVPMDGWYEWRDKAPFLVEPEDGGLILVAGLWDRCGDIVSCTLLTTDAVGHLADLHHRMPRVLGEGEVAAWLDGAGPFADGDVGMTDAGTVGKLTVRPVNKAVGNVANDGGWLLEE